MTPPIALIVSIVAWFRNVNRFAAVAGMVISGFVVLLFVFGMLLPALCR